MAIADIRREYAASELRRSDLDANPLTQFQKWFAVAGGSSGSQWRRIGIALFKLWHAILGHAPVDANAMVLATVDKNGIPSTRTVLLKGVDDQGFVFYTNYDSRKGLEIAENPNAALTFFWPFRAIDCIGSLCAMAFVSQLSHSGNLYVRLLGSRTDFLR